MEIKHTHCYLCYDSQNCINGVFCRRYDVYTEHTSADQLPCLTNQNQTTK